jgi:hypothetical protein
MKYSAYVLVSRGVVSLARLPLFIQDAHMHDVPPLAILEVVLSLPTFLDKPTGTGVQCDGKRPQLSIRAHLTWICRARWLAHCSRAPRATLGASLTGGRHALPPIW